MSLHKIGTRVKLVNLEDPHKNISGMIAGHAFVATNFGEEMDAIYVVALDEGYWLEGNVSFITKVLAHPDSLEEVE